MKPRGIASCYIILKLNQILTGTVAAITITNPANQKSGFADIIFLILSSKT